MSEVAEVRQPPQPLKGLIGAPAEIGSWWLFLVVLLAAVIAAYYLLRRWRARRSNLVAPTAAVANAAVPVPAISLVDRWRRLTVAEPFSIDDQRHFAFELSLILRLALSGAVQRETTEMTTEEIAQFLPRVWRWSDDLQREFLATLASLDAVKYAGEPLSGERARLWQGDAKAWLVRFSVILDDGEVRR